MREVKKKTKVSTSPRASTTSSKICSKKQVFLNAKAKKKPKKTRPSYNQTALTDTESTKVPDLLKKGYLQAKPKKDYMKSKPKANLMAPTKQPSKLKTSTKNNISTSRSPGCDETQSTISNRKDKIKPTIGNRNIKQKRTHLLRSSGESISVASEKPKATYFMNTLDSHNLIQSATIKNNCKQFLPYPPHPYPYRPKS